MVMPQSRSSTGIGSRTPVGESPEFSWLWTNAAAGACVIVAMVLMLSSGCSRTYTVTRQMSWSVAELPAPARPLPPGAVRLTFSNAPKYHIVVESPVVRGDLEHAGKKSVVVTFRVRRQLWTQSDTCTVVSIDGWPFDGGGAESYMESLDVSPKDPGPFDAVTAERQQYFVAFQ